MYINIHVYKHEAYNINIKNRMRESFRFYLDLNTCEKFDAIKTC